MQLMSVVEAWIFAAMQSAQSEELEDGTIVASVPGLEGIVASGSDIHECGERLYARLEDYVRVGLAKGYSIPQAGDIDLNAETARLLATYHPTRIASVQPPPREFFEGTADFKHALKTRQRRS